MESVYTCGYPVGSQYRNVSFKTSTWLRDQLKQIVSFAGWSITPEIKKQRKIQKKKEGTKKQLSRTAFYIIRYITSTTGVTAKNIIISAFPEYASINALKVSKIIDKLEKTGVIYKIGKFGHEKYFLNVANE